MSFFTRLPPLSLSLLFFIYGVLGWSLAEVTPNRLYWLGAGVGILLITLFFTAPSIVVRTVITSPIESDTRAFISVIVMALGVVVILTWFHYFTHLLILLAAGALGRLELQGAKYREWSAFWIMIIVSLVGFGLGLAGYTFLINPVEGE